MNNKKQKLRSIIREEVRKELQEVGRTEANDLVSTLRKLVRYSEINQAKDALQQASRKGYLSDETEKEVGEFLEQMEMLGTEVKDLIKNVKSDLPDISARR